MNPTDPPEVASLKAAIAGLLYPSECDSPFDVFAWPAGTFAKEAKAAVAAHAPRRARIVEQSLDDFFAALKGVDDEPRYADLRRLLESTLTDLQVFRAGRTRVHVYLVGRAPSGGWLGLHTLSIET
jgi:hypothetical protein